MIQRGCSGFLGVLFGHTFSSKIVLYEPAVKKVETKGRRVVEMMGAMANKKYVIVCSRCGMVVTE
jgi:hypothetical protein